MTLYLVRMSRTEYGVWSRALGYTIRQVPYVEAWRVWIAS